MLLRQHTHAQGVRAWRLEEKKKQDLERECSVEPERTRGKQEASILNGHCSMTAPTEMPCFGAAWLDGGQPSQGSSDDLKARRRLGRAESGRGQDQASRWVSFFTRSAISVVASPPPRTIPSPRPRRASPASSRAGGLACPCLYNVVMYRGGRG